MTKAGKFEYKMPDKMAREFLKNRSAEDKKLNPNEYLCRIVNEQFGLLYNCVKVIRY